jgi:uncharacterized SAM-dependent methyltransferase
MQTDIAPPRPRAGPRFFDQVTDGRDRARAELARTLLAVRASIPPKYFYDRLGSALFAAITELPEYYPTRTEATILAAHRAAIAARVGPGATLVDLGAGDCRKAASLLDALPRQCQLLPIPCQSLLHRNAQGKSAPPSLAVLLLREEALQRCFPLTPATQLL